MRILGKTIYFRSIPEIYDKELDGRKPNTIRVLDLREFDIVNDYWKMQLLDTINIENTDTGDSFERKITDITAWDGRAIFSWAHEDLAGGISMNLGDKDKVVGLMVENDLSQCKRWGYGEPVIKVFNSTQCSLIPVSRFTYGRLAAALKDMLKEPIL